MNIIIIITVFLPMYKSINTDTFFFYYFESKCDNLDKNTKWCNSDFIVQEYRPRIAYKKFTIENLMLQKCREKKKNQE